jgi:hypothetical protein
MKNQNTGEVYATMASKPSRVVAPNRTSTKVMIA